MPIPPLIVGGPAVQSGRAPVSMTLAELITPRRVIADLDATEQWPAIDEMLDVAVAGGDLPEEARPLLMDSLRQREAQCSTGIGSGVAIPHAYSDHVDEITAVFARSREGIDVCALDSNPVHFIVLILVPTEQHKAHLRTLAAIARALSHGELRRRLAEAEGAEELVAILREGPAGV